MIFKLIKLASWLKGHWKPIIGIISTALLIYASCQTQRAGKWKNEHLRLEGKLEEQKADQDRLYEEAEKEKLIRDSERIREKEERTALEARIQRVIEEGKKAKRALEQEKEKTAVLPATELVAQINERIGDESSLTAGGLFLFTRMGANRTLDKFKDGEFHLSEYNKMKEAMVDHDTEVASFNKSLAKCEKAEATNMKGWEDCRETLTTALDDINTLKKVSTAVIWKGRLQGAAAGSVITIVACKIIGIF